MSPLTEFRKIFVAIFESECTCGMYSQKGDGADFYVLRSNPNFGHLETCHVTISARVLGWKVVKK